MQTTSFVLLRSSPSTWSPFWTPTIKISWHCTPRSADALRVGSHSRWRRPELPIHFAQVEVLKCRGK
jgi:hypothetical protein